MFDIAIVGGGIIGLSTAYEISKLFPNKKIAILEKESEVGKHQTSHNSGVIHSGLYYKPGSLKAINCRTGIALLRKFCEEQSIKYEICGKLVIASKKSQIDSLNELYVRGKKNGIKGLDLVKKSQISKYEPYAIGEGALFCSETGIIDYFSISKRLKDLIQKNCTIFTSFEVVDIYNNHDEIILSSDIEDVRSKFLINCAGLFSDKIASLSGLNHQSKIIPFRGEYYMVKKQARYLVKNLIYPVPDPRYPFLGVHFTRTLNGKIEAGPNAVLAFAKEGYKKTDINFKEMFDYLSFPGFWKMAAKYYRTALGEYYRSFSKKFFLKSLQELVPNIKSEDLKKGPSGVRAQALGSDGSLIDDFVIYKKKNMIHVINAPSPAATSSFSIGSRITQLYTEIIK